MRGLFEAESRNAAVGASATARPPVNQLALRVISLGLALAVVLFVGMSAFGDWNAFVTAASRLPGALWVQLVALSVLSYLLRFARWHSFLRMLGHSVPIVRSLEIYLSAFALTLTPGKAGETVRSVYLSSHGVNWPHSIGAFVSERLLDVVAVAVLASLAISLFPEQRPWLLAATACLVSVALVLRSRLLSSMGTRLARGSSPGHLAKAIAAMRFLLSGRRLALAAPLTLIAWTAQGVSLYLTVRALGWELPAGTAVAIYCVSILAGAASFVPGGLGTTEAAIALLLSAAGVGRTDAIIAALVSRTLTLWLAVGIGVVAMTKTALATGPERSAPG